MVSFTNKLAVASCLALPLAYAAPIDGLTKRAPKVVGLSFEKHTGPKNGTIPVNIKRDVESSPLTNEQSFYITYLEVGSQKTRIGVDIDTGSSDLWIPSPETSGSVQNFGVFDPNSSDTAEDTGEPFGIGYVDGSSSTGEFYTDTVALGDGSGSVDNFKFAVVDQTSVTQSGIFGIGLTSNEETDFNGGSGPYPNFPVALKDAGYIDKLAYSLYLDSPTATSGSLLFGGKDLAKIDGELVTLPHSGLARDLSVDLNSVTIGGKKIPIGNPYYLDSGTSLTLLPTDVVYEIAKQVGGDGQSHYRTFPIVPCSATGTLSYDFNGISIDVPISDLVAQVDDVTCALAIDMDDNHALLGDTFLRYAYVVYNLEDSSIGLAKPKYTDETNIVAF